ncbi:hypothetical protein SESBI_09457 [Sesbania bispinosa]|nr:hypothetical protein SESBI_09457 [Sesbania bispinosa]
MTPASMAINALGTTIRQHFQDPYPNWTETPGDVKEYWFKLFAESQEPSSDANWGSQHDVENEALRQEATAARQDAAAARQEAMLCIRQFQDLEISYSLE